MGFAGMLFIAGCTSPSSLKDEARTIPREKIQIGWAGPLSGDASGLGQDALKSSELAVKEINESGGVYGKDVELVAEDTKCNAKDAVQAGTKLIEVDNVPVIIGGLCSGETMAIAPLAEENKVVLFSYCSSAPSVTSAGDYVFRTYPSDTFEGEFMAGYVYNTMNISRIAVLAVLGDWGTGIKNTFIKNYEALGGTVVLAEDYDQDTRDLRTELTKVKTSTAEALYFVGYTESSLAGLRQIRELGIVMPIIGSSAWADPKVQESEFAQGILYPEAQSNFAPAWKERMEKAGISTTLCTAPAYNNVKIIADIMQRVGIKPEDIKNALYQVKNYQGVNGAISFDENGDVTSAEYDIHVVQNGKSIIKQ